MHSAPQHLHYHYHYHYDHPHHPLPEPAVHSTRDLRTTSPRTYSSTIENNYWKSHVNPEVSKLYDNFQTRKSRFSENPTRIAEEESVLETPRMPKKMLETQCDEDTSFGEKRPLTKLESLYYQKRSTRQAHEVESVTNETADQFCSIHEEKLRVCRKEIERLRRIEEECVYLRDNFMLHIESRHRSP